MTDMRRLSLPTAVLSLVVVGTQAAEPPALAKLEVFPADVSLHTQRDRQSLVVLATFADGTTRDVSSDAKYSFSNPALVRFDKHTVFPVADGATQLTVAFGGQSLVVPVQVKDAKTERPVSFKLDVMPVFMKAGCNSGSCHGAARGKDGFRLSLFGYDPDGDHFRLTREIPGRRINLALPKECMVVEKATGKVQHTGGKRFDPDSELCQAILRWLEAGAPSDPPNVAKPVALEILPKGAVLEGAGTKQRMTVRATYSDGSKRDVTGLTLFLSNNETSAKIDGDGIVTAGERGEAFVMARFATFTVGSQVIVIPKGITYTFPKVPENNYIDTLVNNKLKKLRIIPSNVCDDPTFLRRASLDICGALPTRAEYEKFVVDKNPQKREKLIDDLLGRKEFAEMWVMKFAELLQMRTTNEVSYKPMLLYYNWLQERIANNVPMNKIVQELLSASGGTFSNAATNYYQIERDTLKVSENVAQVFMGMRIQCAQCHNHPFDRWTMDDYYSFAAFFAQIGRKGAEDPRELIIFNSGGGEVQHPVGNRVMAPKFLGGATPNLAGVDRRASMAEWLASPQNPFFATNLANIVWAHFFGTGIVEPVDDVRVSNPASNPELLEALGKKFTEYNYDFKKLVRDIGTSRTYQLVTATNETNRLDDRNFSHAAVRRIRAEVLLDCISQATETKNKFPGLPNGARAVQIADGRVSTYFLTTFGRATRDTVCSCEVKMEPNLSQALHLLNGEAAHQRVASGGLVPRLINEKKSPDQIIEELYIRCLSRTPTAEERKKLSEILKQEKDVAKALEDVFWALMNSKEFLFNH